MKALLKKISRKHLILISLIALFLIAMYLRFYRVEQWYSFGFDQGRDAEKVRDILHGILFLNGPRTGVGHFYIGPLWYYLLVPFYFITNLDPIAAFYLNFFVNVFNFFALFIVFKKIFSDWWGVFAVFVYTANNYLIEITTTPWNVSPIPGVAALIFYGIYTVVVEENTAWIPITLFLCGLFFHLHFSAVFFIPIVFTSFLFAKNKKQVFIKSALSLPLFFIWFIPLVLFEFQMKNTNASLFSKFLSTNITSFHLQWFLHQLREPFIQFQMIVFSRLPNRFLQFIFPALFFIILIFEKKQKLRKLGFLILLWFIIPLIAYSFYTGSTSEYYLLFTLPAVLYIIVYLQKKLLQAHHKYILLSLIVIWFFYAIYNTKTLWVKEQGGGLNSVKKIVRESIQHKKKIKYEEGSIASYLYFVYTEDYKK